MQLCMILCHYWFYKSNKNGGQVQPRLLSLRVEVDGCAPGCVPIIHSLILHLLLLQFRSTERSTYKRFYTVSQKKSLMFLAITRKSIVGFS